jgi:hypothetical protein
MRQVAAPTNRRLESKLVDESHPFLSGQPKELRNMLGDFFDLSYTQWEAFLALHHGISLYVFSPSTGRSTEVREQHLERLLAVDCKSAHVSVRRFEFFPDNRLSENRL